jgi:hypothetical protein
MAESKNLIYNIKITEDGTVKIKELNIETKDTALAFQTLNDAVLKNTQASNVNASTLSNNIRELKRLRDATTTTNEEYRKQTDQIRILEGEYRKLTAVTNTQTDKTGLASATLVEFSRGVQDANYGFRGVANNLSQLTTLMTTLIGTTGGLTNAFAALRKAFTGPIGFLVVANLVIAAIENITMRQESNTDAVDDNTRAIEDNIKARREQLGLLKQNIDTLTDEFELLIARGTTGMAANLLRSEETLLAVQALLIDAGIKEAEILSDQNIFIEERAELALQLYQREKLQLDLAEEIRALREAESDTDKKTHLRNITNIQEAIVFNQKLIDSVVKNNEVEVKSTRTKNTKLADDRLKFEKEVEDALAVFESQQFLLKRKRLEDHYEKLIEQTRKNGENTINLELAKFAALKQFDEERRLQIEQEQEKKDADAEREVLREIRINKAKNKAKDDQLKYEQEIEIARVGFAKQISGIFAAIGEEGKGLAKAALLLEKGAAIADIIIKAQQSIATQKAAAASYTLQTRAAFAAGGPIGFAAGEALIKRNQASLLKNISQTKIGAGLSIAKIVATSLSKKGEGVAASVPSAAEPSAPQIQAPAFNVVGATQTSQLAQTIAGAEDKPIKAFVVASDVTTAQELERSTIEGASIG